MKQHRNRWHIPVESAIDDEEVPPEEKEEKKKK